MHKQAYSTENLQVVVSKAFALHCKGKKPVHHLSVVYDILTELTTPKVYFSSKEKLQYYNEAQKQLFAIEEAKDKKNRLTHNIYGKNSLTVIFKAKQLLICKYFDQLIIDGKDINKINLTIK